MTYQINIEKLKDYVLDSNHPKGKDKAKRFREKLGYLQEDAQTVQKIILELVNAMEFPEDFNLKNQTEYGIHYEILLTVPGKTNDFIPVSVCTAWIKRYSDPDILSLITCYIKD